MKSFDAYAHNPYYGVPTETPTTRPPGTLSGEAPTAITLANIDVLIAEVGHLYGPGRCGSPSTATRRIRPTPTSACPGRNRRST